MVTRRSDPDVELPEGHDVMVSRGPCPKCDTSRRFVTYADGHSHCHKCGHHESGRANEAPPPKAETPVSQAADALKPLPGAKGYPDLKAAGGISSATLKRYGYFVAGYHGTEGQVSQYYSDASTIAHQKVRLPDKTFPQIRLAPEAPPLTDCWLFGRNVYGDRFDRSVVVTEGERDAMAVAQVLDFKMPVVSVNSGAKAAARCLKANYLWLDRFSQIILWLDDDDEGNAATAECAKLFKVGKVRIARVEGFKDACDVLKAGRPGDIEAAVYGATAWRPKGIVSAGDNVKDVLKPVDEADDGGWSYPWPWQELTDKLGPIKSGQVTYHVAGTGVGKTTAVAEIAYSLIRAGATIVWMGFEDTRRDAKLRLMSIHVSDRLDINPRPDAEMAAIHEDLFKTDKVWMFDPETAEWSVEAILGYIRYCVKALDCRVLFVDPLTFIAAGLEVGDDERRALDKVSRDLAALAKELGCGLQISHHLRRPEGVGHEEGAATSLNQVRGSGGIANFATFVIGHERNQQADGEEALDTTLRILKNRPRSWTGAVLKVKYNPMTGRLTAEGAPNKPSRSGKQPRSRMPPIDNTDF